MCLLSVLTWLVTRVCHCDQVILSLIIKLSRSAAKSFINEESTQIEPDSVSCLDCRLNIVYSANTKTQSSTIVKWLSCVRLTVVCHFQCQCRDVSHCAPVPHSPNKQSNYSDCALGQCAQGHTTGVNASIATLAGPLIETRTKSDRVVSSVARSFNAMMPNQWLMYHQHVDSLLNWIRLSAIS